MHLTDVQDFPAPPAAVHALLTDPAFLRQAADAMGAPDATVTASPGATSIAARVPAPARIRSFVGADVPLVLDVTWGDAAADGTREGTFRLTVPGTPVTAAGTARLAPTASGSTLTQAGEVTVAVPLLGARIEKEVAPVVLAALADQARLARERLKG